MDRYLKIDLTKAASEELNRLVKSTGLSPEMVWQKSFNLLRAYLKADARGDAWIILPCTSVDNLSNYSRVVVPGISNR